MKIKIFDRIFKSVRCKIGFHNWQVVKSIKLSNLIFIIKKHKPILKNVNLNYDFDYLVTNRECKECGVKDFEIDNTKKVLEEEMFTIINLKKKK